MFKFTGFILLHMWRIYIKCPQRKIPTRILNAYYSDFRSNACRNISEHWTPNFACFKCARYLRSWVRGTHVSMPFVEPVIWREQQDHLTDCYFCLTKLKGFSIKIRHQIEYANVKSVSKTVPHADVKPITSN